MDDKEYERRWFLHSKNEAQRIGMPGLAWATRYTDGWSVYSLDDGFVARGLNEWSATLIVSQILSTIQREDVDG
jgi:hypothetical protein